MKKLFHILVILLFAISLSSIDLKPKFAGVKFTSPIKTAIIQHYPNFTDPFLIWKGDEHEVWGSHNSKEVIKGTINNSLGVKLTKEYLFLKRAKAAIDQYDRDKTLQKRAIIPTVSKLMVSDPSTLLTMQRLYPIKEERSKKLTHLYLAYTMYNIPYLNEIVPKGNYKGYEQIKNIVAKYPPYSKNISNLDLLCSDMGRLLAILQLSAQIDGYNTQVTLCRLSNKQNNYKIALFSFIHSFDMAKYFRKLAIDKIVNRYLLTLNDSNYFPKPHVPSFPAFRKGYYEVAEKLAKNTNNDNYVKIAERLFKRYINNWASNYLLPVFLKKNEIMSPEYLEFFQALLPDQEIIKPFQKEVYNSLAKHNFYMEERDLMDLAEKALYKVTDTSTLEDFKNKIKAKRHYPKK